MTTTTAPAAERWAVQRLVWSRGSRQTWRTISPKPMQLKAALHALMTTHNFEIRLVTGVTELMTDGALDRSTHV